ncbi:calcium-activated chloride channel regulator 1-like [Daktulosphaira vitifoliae]|uniref:calcium-activated chloride channel regulator 1-like n=1 Tax=Daktulosphaira vitifoliae TaxID=58002 RepID=UPI0021AAAC48|nr:calcium-activated chloride channel regulator 1-like [Daktulosphaira vitifoliae]
MATVLRFLAALCCLATASPAVYRSGGYDNVVISIKDSVSPANCKHIINNIEAAFTSGSKSLYEALSGKAYFRSVTVTLPQNWPDNCVGHTRTIAASQGEIPDILVGQPHPVYGDAMWTQQSQSCGRSGDALYGSYRLFQEQRELGKDIAKQWAKYRYGVFDEVGYAGDSVYPACYFSETSEGVEINGCSDKPISKPRSCDLINITNSVHPEAKTSLMFSTTQQVTKFCDASSHDRYAPTKQNALCGRRSIMEVINTHQDFTKGVNLSDNQNLTPIFTFKREMLTRYVVIIEDTKDMIDRESWSFLRLAIRKWAVYDLPPNTEVGLVSANDSSANRLHGLSHLLNNDARDQVASNIPYSPGDSRVPACLSCAIKEAIQMLETRASTYGQASSVIVVIAPGTLAHTPDLNKQVSDASDKNIRIATITYPMLKRPRSLDWMAEKTGGVYFSVDETRYNMAQSFLSTYFKLTNVMRNIVEIYYQGNKGDLPVEIHRRELIDDGRTTVTGNFVLEDFMGEPAKFTVYTHNTENPLIRAITLTSPSQRVYSTRSDSLLSLKMLSVPATINETGTWTYSIERFQGSPQPHYIQVMAKPLSKNSPVVRARAWTSGTTNPLAIYTEVKRGEYPVLGAKVEVLVIRPGLNGSGTHREKFDLLDTGSGDPDLMKGDGIYSRFFNPMIGGPGTYTFEITVSDNGNTAYTWQSSIHRNVERQPINTESNCCGSFMAILPAEPLNPFQRIIAPMSVTYNSDDLSSSTNVGRVGDLIAEIFKSEQKAKLTWTSPDLGGNFVARYEIRYSQSLRSLLNDFDSAPIWDHGRPDTFAPGAETIFYLEMNKNPSLFDQTLYIAIKGYSQVESDAVPSPVSNWVKILVPSPPPPPSHITTHSSTGSDPSWSIPDQNMIPRITRDFEINYDVVVPAAGGILLLGVLLLMYCIFCAVKRNRKPEKQSPKQEKPLNVSVIPNGGGNMTISSPMNSVKAELEAHFEPCLIDTSEKKRYSISQYGQTELHQNQPSQPYHHQSNGHLSIISNAGATLTRTVKPLSPYQSWTASQLLHEHERRISPYGQIGDFENQYPPPVPPLPAYQHQPNGNIGENIYGTAPGHLYQQNGLPPPGQHTNNYHRNNMILFNQSLQGSLSSVSSGDKKKRNITMV